MPAYAQSIYKIGRTSYTNALLAAAKVGDVLNVTSPSISRHHLRRGANPWLGNLTVVTQDKSTPTTNTPIAPEPVIDGRSFSQDKHEDN